MIAEEPQVAEIALEVPGGIPGFEQHRAWRLVEDLDHAPFARLASVSPPGVEFLLVDPRVAKPDYPIDVPEGARLKLGAPPDEPLRLFAVVRSPKAGPPTINLRAPLVVAPASGRATQMILDGGGWPLRFPLDPRR